LSRIWRSWKEGTGDGVADRLCNLIGRRARVLIERDYVLGEAAGR
jgi:hypothetical protein